MFEVISPNPATNPFTLQFQLQNNSTFAATITITNLLGEIVFEKTSQCINGKLSETIYTDENFSEGMYLVRVNSANGQWVKPLAIQK